MKHQKTVHGARHLNTFHAERKMLVRPSIIGGVEQDGKDYYVGVNNELYEKIAFDKMFKAPGGIVKKKNFREDIARKRNGNFVVE